MVIDIERLSEQALLGSAMARLGLMGDVREVSAGTVLYRAGGDLTDLILVQAGRVLVETPVDGMDRAVPVEEAGRGVFLGLPDLADGVHSETAVAIARSRLVVVNTRLFTERVAASGELALLAVGLLSMGLRQRIGAISDQRSLSARGRLIAYLLALIPPAREPGPRVSLRLPMAKGTLAAYLGMTPQSLSRAFRDLRGLGVTVRGATVDIADPTPLHIAIEADRGPG